MPLLPATPFGSVDVFDGLPEIEELYGAIFTPNTPAMGRGWGIHDAGGALVPASAYRSGPGREASIQEARLPMDPAGVVAEAPDALYVYAGAIHPHYGHFLLSTLSRFWPLARHGGFGCKFLVHGGDGGTGWMAPDYVSYALERLGLGAEDFVCFTEPTRIRRLLVPNPAVEEQSRAFRVFAELAHKVAGAEPAAADRTDTPAYLTKQALRRGVWRFVNEDVVSEVLARHGVDVISPELLTFPEQVRLFQTRSVVCGAVGSGLHTSVFARRPPRVIGYNRDPGVFSNFMLLDRVNGTDGQYFFPAEGFTVAEETAEFTLNCRLNDPVQVAEDLLRLMERPVATRPVGTGAGAAAGVAMAAAEPEGLDAIGLRFGTDKASSTHDLLRVYEAPFGRLRGRPGLVVLEIGVLHGASIRTWEAFFPEARVVGMDNDPATAGVAGERRRVAIGDASNMDDLVRVAREFGPFDLVIDDGSHFWADQILGLQVLYPWVKPGGLYVVEHVDTSFGRHVGTYGRGHPVSAAGFLQRLADRVVGGTAMDDVEADPFIRAYAPLTESVSFVRCSALVARGNR